MCKYGSGKNYGSGLHYGSCSGTEVTESEWSPLLGGNHFGQDWLIASDLVISGEHINVGNFYVAPGVVVNVQPYSGSAYGYSTVKCRSAEILGSLSGSFAGFTGGGGGGGGGGAGVSSGGSGGLGGDSRYGSDGTSGSAGATGTASLGGSGGAGASGHGTYAGAGGSPGVSGGSNGSSGTAGGYLAAEGQGDATTDTSLVRGSGGGGGGGGAGQNTVIGTITGGGGGSGGAAGGSGGAYLKIEALGLIKISGSVISHGGFRLSGYSGSSGTLNAGGSGGSGGATDEEEPNGSAGSSYPGGASGGTGGAGGRGAGGGILLYTSGGAGLVVSGTVKNLGGGTESANGGTLKKFYISGKKADTGTTATGRDYNNESLRRAEIS